jgi:hypothetical protein
MGPVGPEHPHESPTNRGRSENGGAQSGALDARHEILAPLPGPVQRIIQEWDTLPPEVQQDITARCEAALSAGNSQSVYVNEIPELPKESGNYVDSPPDSGADRRAEGGER